MEQLWEQYTKPEYLEIDTTYNAFLRSKRLEPDAERPRGRIFTDDFRARLPEELQISSYLAGEAVDFIMENKSKQFVLYVSFLEPHPPFYGPLDNLYDPKTLPVDPTFLKKPTDHSLFNQARANFFMQSEFNCVPDENTRIK